MNRSPSIFTSPSAAARQLWVRRWVSTRRRAHPDQAIVLVAQHLSSAGDLLHPLLLDSGPEPSDDAPRDVPGSLLLVHRSTLDLLALDLARAALAERGLALATPVIRAALVGRVIHDCGAELGHFSAVAHTPGFARALTSTLDELRLHAVGPVALSRLPLGDALDLRQLLARYEGALAEDALVDRAGLLRIAHDALQRRDPRASEARALILADVEITSPVEVDLLRALGEHAPALAATVPHGDGLTAGALRLAWPDAAWRGVDEVPARTPSQPALARVQAGLFGDATPCVEAAGSEPCTAAAQREPAESEGSPDDSLAIFSAPSEALECVEIARRCLALVRAGTPAEQIAVLVRHPLPYVELLDEAFRRGGLAVYLAEGMFRPDPAGRAFLLLLRSKLEGLRATRFAEYLSLGQTPVPEGLDVEHDDRAGDELSEREDAETREGAASLDSAQSTVPPAGYVAPARWERLIGDAAVIGGRDRWERRLRGLLHQIGERRRALVDPESALGRALARDERDLAALAAFALPLVSALERLPEQARWEQWIEQLEPLARRALRRPERVIELLHQLWPLCHAGPVALGRVIDALERQLTDLRRPPPRERYGRVYIGVAHEVRGRAFDAVFVAGLAERSFPQKVLQDPVLLDRTRERLEDSALSPAVSGMRAELHLARAADRRRYERLALHLAIGAARRQLTLSYPRMTLAQGQARVPSFYLLEAVRAARGRLPEYESLIAEAAENGVARLERPYPARPELALDEQEYDLAVLAEADRTRRAQQGTDLSGFSGHLHEHPFLVQALRAHWKRGGPKLSPHDGFLAARDEALALLQQAGPTTRPFAPTTLERYARCPYQFYLYGLLKLRPLQDLEPEGHHHIDPLTRGRLYHEVQFGVFQRLREGGLLPLGPLRRDEALAVLGEVFARVSAQFAEDLAPAVPVQWRHEMDALRAELSGWLRRETEQDQYTPLHFEWAFGLAGERSADEASRAEPARVGPFLLRGAIDLIERAADGRVRVTDYKTGRAPLGHDSPLRGGTSLQRVLYGLAYEALAEGVEVHEGRLYYCSERGGFRELALSLDANVRAKALAALGMIDEAIRSGTLPAAPLEDCLGCDYVRICGRDAAQRARRKRDARLNRLAELRRL